MICPGLHKTRVNGHINLDAFRCFYGSFNDAVALVIKHEVCALSAKLDLANAFKHILIRSQYWPVLGLSWEPPASRQFFMPPLLCGPFSSLWVCAAPLALFNEYADALQYAMKTNKVQELLHYLDDYFTVDPSQSPVCANSITTMIATCARSLASLLIQKK